MTKYDSFISLKEAFAPYLRETQGAIKKAKKNALNEAIHQLYARVEAKVAYLGYESETEFSDRSESIYLKIGVKQIRISGHPVAPGNYRSNIEFLTYESPLSITRKLIMLKYSLL